jgi:hypothetical protein
MYDYIIVGGGISGLYCAIHLTNVLVLEESNRWGGKIKKHYHPKYEKTGRFHKKHTRLWNLIKRFNLTPYRLNQPLDRIPESESDSESEPVSTKDYLMKMIHITHTQSECSFYQKCVSVMGESDALNFVYALGYHEMCFMNAYDSLHSFSPDYCQQYYALKEGMNELCFRMVNAIKGTCLLNHSVKKITRIEDHVKVDGYEGKRVIVTIPPSLFKKFPILSPYDLIAPTLVGPPLLRIYAKYPIPVWFESFTLALTQHILYMHDGILLVVYVTEEDLRKFTYHGKLKRENELRVILQDELSTMFPLLKIPPPLWIKPYLWELGIHRWLRYPIETFPEIEKVFVCGDAFSTRHSWIEGSLESAESTLHKIKSDS